MSTKNNFRMSKFTLEALLLALIFCEGLIYSLLTRDTSRSLWPTPVVAGHSSSRPELWRLANIHIETNDPYYLVTAMGNQVIFLGGDNSSEPQQIIAVDGYTGEIRWRQYDQDIGAIAAAGSTVFEGGNGEVTARNAMNGRYLWSTHLFPSGGISRLVVAGDALYAAGSIWCFQMDLKTGELQKKHPQGCPAFRDLVYGYMGYDRYSERVVALNLETGQQVWQHDFGVHTISDLAGPHLYSLSLKGDLFRLGAITGSVALYTRFSPSPFKEGSEESDGSSRGYSYQIAGDDKFLFVYLGDSAELFAYKISP